jgi:hypothetical protein
MAASERTSMPPLQPRERVPHSAIVDRPPLTHHHLHAFQYN